VWHILSSKPCGTVFNVQVFLADMTHTLHIVVAIFCTTAKNARTMSPDIEDSGNGVGKKVIQPDLDRHGTISILAEVMG
jgi:hypothetical protein